MNQSLEFLEALLMRNLSLSREQRAEFKILLPNPRDSFPTLLTNRNA